MSAQIPLIALIGRPNVGKSTLFNRLTRRRDALVDPTPGVTRDRHYARIEWEGRACTLVDTGGIEEGDEGLPSSIREQALLAVEEADIIFFLMDGREGPTPGDAEIADLLRRAEKPVFPIVNKIDSPDLEETLLSPFWELGMDRLWPLSADHGRGFDELTAALLPHLDSGAAHEELPENTLRISIAGSGEQPRTITIEGDDSLADLIG